ncbi:acetyl esterase/lipase [Kribbella aluminosa]|uniref:Acetyl esterase/lipase n=1 Tax=Kribbella aluminosa TaxID=416017 RepID=A0ABS4UIP8_9ACTN|nr:acetyl esterase/lipase [Kribbella aluminosa]
MVLRIHGGGFTRFSADSFSATDVAIARMGAMVVSVDYRLAPMHPFPAAPEDCYAALCWAYDALEIDRSRVVVTGSSAGGALAAAVSLLARDRSGPRITHQLLHVPALDDRLSTFSMQQHRRSNNGLTFEDVAEMWHVYLPPGTDRRRTSRYAAPARTKALAGLPATFIQVNELDPLRDEGLCFAQRLLRAGVPVEVYCAPGLGHGAVPGDSPVAALAQRIFDAAMLRALTERPPDARPTPGVASRGSRQAGVPAG